MSSDLKRDQLVPPGGIAQNVIGNPMTSTVNTVTHMVHPVTTTATLTTLNPPSERTRSFVGPVYLRADSVFSWTSSGNIAVGPGTTLVANRAYGFIYDALNSRWNPLGQIV